MLFEESGVVIKTNLIHQKGGIQKIIYQEETNNHRDHEITRKTYVSHVSTSFS